ncbi:2-trimethylaminoethylphosphonate dioxygenase [Streptomyces sp. NBC_00503]|uniref:2-trimethylaminoethylphosphonate dioxygenase n=1 Tax=Streptomyces sp. NBC_00503 TaxID=2903659 RepID=UPI002E80C88C|nr:TauD/TfdA family dioxygenase [Streptomyces sp. NBC_00503]WUD79479.1 TauD/TfdA family dioxygenase [Streptomyces sp. NBC_00503]
MSATAITRPPAPWLRDNCPCAECRDPRTGQKLFQITELPAGLAIGSVHEAPTADGGPGWEVVWQPDGHHSVYAVEWLDAHAPDGAGSSAGARAGDGRTEADKQLWAAADLAGRIPEVRWDAYISSREVRERALDSVVRLGFVLLRDVPCRDRMVLDVARTFGFVRETNYGELFEVRVEADPNNLAFTGARITPHTDNPYRDPVPTLQLLHCLRNEAQGGDSGLVDGFHAASLLREREPEAFEALTRVPVEFAFADARTELRAHQPLIGVDPLGRVREVRFNNRSISTLHQPAAVLEEFYAAYRLFGEILERPELRLDFRLAPGDCVVFDNTRLLHARTAFAESGGRHLQGTYADLDGLLSTLAVLRREGASA